MRQVWISKAGAPEVLQLREARDPAPAAGQIRIRVEACGVNFADVMGRMGLYPDLPPIPCVPGYEVAGRVDAVGAGVDAGWIGRDVLAMTRFGGYADVVCVPANQVYARPDGMSAGQGAAFPVNYLTAWQLIVVMGSLHSGETMLVHSAGGGVGIAATQIAKRIGARVIGTASAGKHDFLKSAGVDHCIDPRGEDFEARVREITGGRGVELVLDAVGAESFRKSFRSLAPTGRLGLFGLSAVATGKRRNLVSLARAGVSTLRTLWSPMQLMDQNRGVFGVNVGHLWGEIDRLAGWLDALMEGHREGAFRPVIARTFRFDEAPAAHHFLQDRKNVGKVLLMP